MVQIVFQWHHWPTIQWKYLCCCQHSITCYYTSKCAQGHSGEGSNPLYCLKAIWLYKWHWGWISDPPTCLNTRNHTDTTLNIVASVLTLLNTPRAIEVEAPTHSISCIPFYGINGIVGASQTHSTIWRPCGGINTFVAMSNSLTYLKPCPCSFTHYHKCSDISKYSQGHNSRGFNPFYCILV